MNKLIKNIIKNKRNCYFVSPHLDDAALSAGGIISYLAKKTNVEVITVFTKCREDRHSLSALSYIKQSGFKGNQAKQLYSLRRKEDLEVFNRLGVEVRHLGFVDALWRRKKNIKMIDRISGTFLNDFLYIYPTHRWHISKGRINNEDIDNLKSIDKKLRTVLPADKHNVIFCPIGLGGHVDHIVTREVCKTIYHNIIYWEDFPYNMNNEIGSDIKEFIHKYGLNKYVVNEQQEERKTMYSAYKSQLDMLFNGIKEYQNRPEVYYHNLNTSHESIMNSDLELLSKHKKYK